MNEQITVTPAEGLWVVRAEGAIIAESRTALALADGSGPGAVYFPRSDVAMAFLEPSGTARETPVLGQTAYFTISSPGGDLADAAWSPLAPPPGLAQLIDHVAFDGARVTVEQL